MGERWKELMDGAQVPGYIAPLFWQHGEDGELLREEIRQMRAAGIDSFVVESRPHPDYLGDGWWRDLEVILAEALELDMKVWLFDDCQFPSGFAGGFARDAHPEYLKTYLAERHIDAIGPLKGSSFLVDLWLEKEEKLLGVVAAKRADGADGADGTNGADRIDGATLTDIGHLVHDGVLHWDVPEGAWRVFILVRTRLGGEAYTKDYINPIDERAVGMFIDRIYEAHYRKYAEHFGRTIAGFFTDEPRFGNVGSYDASLGRKQLEFPYGGEPAKPGYSPYVLPWSDTLPAELDKAWNGSQDGSVSVSVSGGNGNENGQEQAQAQGLNAIRRWLPLLWYEGGDQTAAVRFTFMNTVSKLFGQNYMRQIGDWCRSHGVKLIGHVVEDNGAHARLGFGSGHFFRSVSGMDYSGVDVVYHLWPEFTEGKFHSPFGYLDADFFYWGLIKMASSAAHIDPAKQGTTICEAFGAYGWQEGLKLMKWITDHICVRGVNFIVPHAFSPKYPDPDCPPHFYARGENPQWRFFTEWSRYANRVCHLLSGGRHVASAAVVYHAEAEWAGGYQPFEKVVKELALRQIDCDVVPIDTIVAQAAVTAVRDGQLVIHEESYKIIIVPYAECLPEAFMTALLELTRHGATVLFSDGLPSRSVENSAGLPELLGELARRTAVCALDGLSDWLGLHGLRDIEVGKREPSLRYCHYVREGEELYFFVNESRSKVVHTPVTMKHGRVKPVAYDALRHEAYEIDCVSDGETTTVDLWLEPYESIFLVYSTAGNAFVNEALQQAHFSARQSGQQLAELLGQWTVSLADAENYPQFRPAAQLDALTNLASPALFPSFSGTISYETKFEVRAEEVELYATLDLNEAYEITEAWLNDQPLGIRICPPYRYDIGGRVTAGVNRLRIEVTNTLVKRQPSAFDRAMAQEPSGLIGPVVITNGWRKPG
ncbi:glycosyl hydrolase [Cohnella silvisoli]|uniref:Glycosyl hydrolase n=1 Tax=Cohnella silvisoli TaxID=2873699 RepID=A0ABV1KRV8_9BACL|nr:glycosyl hydrolase [Cohnella silvisoli]MCD9022536.1 glycosyl transferase family 2 [Cohnella silvisoli]